MCTFFCQASLMFCWKPGDSCRGKERTTWTWMLAKTAKKSALILQGTSAHGAIIVSMLLSRCPSCLIFRTSTAPNPSLLMNCLLSAFSLRFDLPLHSGALVHHKTLPTNPDLCLYRKPHDILHLMLDTSCLLPPLAYCFLPASPSLIPSPKKQQNPTQKPQCSVSSLSCNITTAFCSFCLLRSLPVMLHLLLPRVTLMLFPLLLY